MIRLNTPATKSLMLVVHLVAIAAGIAAGMWIFDTFS